MANACDVDVLVSILNVGMLADDTASTNKFLGSVYANAGQQLDLYGDNIEVGYHGYEDTAENLSGF